MALGAVVRTADRQADFTFTDPIDNIHLTLVITKPGPNQPLRATGIYDLIKDDDITFGVIRGSETAIIMETAQDGTVTMLWSTILRKSAFVENIYEGLEKVRSENFVLILDSASAEYYIGQEPCDLMMVGAFLHGRHYAFAIRNGQELLGKVNNAIKKVKSEHSQLYMMKSKWFKSECTKTSSEDTPFGNGGGE